MTKLVVTSAFASYGVGQEITESSAIASILGSANKAFVVAVADTAAVPGVVSPLLPNALIEIAGVPDSALATTYGYASDIVGLTLYRWAGTLWTAILQATALPAAPVDLSAPTIIGTAQVGQLLACSPGTWSGAPTGFAYQWLRNGVAIVGATGFTYAPSADDVGAALSCAVVASNAGGASAAAVSAATSAVLAAATVGTSLDTSATTDLSNADRGLNPLI